MSLPVLIETLWNVKKIVGMAFGDGGVVLIETLWNVKMVETKEEQIKRRY